MRQPELRKAIASALGVALEHSGAIPALAAASPPAGTRVLLVEDDPINGTIARAMLESLGCAVIQAVNGRQAVELASPGGIDVVLMDCQMPEMDGFAATRAIRTYEQVRAGGGGPTRPVPIIALTANAMQGDRERCLAAGMDDYLSKPFTRADLGSRLAHWTNRAPSRAARSEQEGAVAG